MEQMSSKMVSWKTNHLSFVGHVTLAKSVLKAVSIYPMTKNLLPKACIEEIHHMQKNFIWGIHVKRRDIIQLIGDWFLNKKVLVG